MTSPIGEPGRDYLAPDDEIPGEDPIVLDNSRITPGDDAQDDDLVVLDNSRITSGDDAREGDLVGLDDGRTPPGDGAPSGQQVVLEGELVLDDDRVVPGGHQIAPANGESDRQPPAAAHSAGGSHGTDSAHGTGTAGQWPDIQATFVDDPRASVERAADLVDDCVQALVASVTERQQALRSDWQGTGTDTEELRTALQRYRTFWSRLEDFSHQS